MSNTNTNIYGLIIICVIDGYRCFIIITDDYSRYGSVYLMKHKFESIKGLKNSEVLERR